MEFEEDISDGGRELTDRCPCRGNDSLVLEAVDAADVELRALCGGSAL